jgi:tRNA U54 and U55 pseudouridine synthase Pus10
VFLSVDARQDAREMERQIRKVMGNTVRFAIPNLEIRFGPIQIQIRVHSNNVTKMLQFP